MEYIETKFGSLPKLGLGTFSLSKECLEQLIPESIKLGYTLFDTARKYRNEAYIGDVLKKVKSDRANYLLETKINAEQLLGNLRFLRLNGMSVCRAYKLASKALDVSYIDILMLHSPFIGYENYFLELHKLKQEKKIKFVGICNISKLQILELKEKTGFFPDIVQCEIHPYHTNKDLILYCKTNGILVEARSPFAHGDAIEYWLREDVLLTLAVKYKKSIPQIILRWIVQQNVIALPRSSDLEHLRENINIFDFTLLEKEMKAIDELNKNLSYGFVSSRI